MKDINAKSNFINIIYIYIYNVTDEGYKCTLSNSQTKPFRVCSIFSSGTAVTLLMKDLIFGGWNKTKKKLLQSSEQESSLECTGGHCTRTPEPLLAS